MNKKSGETSLYSSMSLALAMFLALPLLVAEPAFAQAQDSISFQAMIKLPSGEKPSRSGLTVKGYVLSPNNCILREEVFSNVTMTAGYINLSIGSGTRSAQDPGFSLEKIFDVATGFSSLVCLDSNFNVDSGKTSYNPASEGTVKKFRVSFNIDSLPLNAEFNIKSVAHALNSRTLDGKGKSEFIQTSTQLTQARLEDFISKITAAADSAIKWNGSAFEAYTPSSGGGSLSPVATSGSYNDLSNLPTLGSLAGKSNVNLSGSEATGILAPARLPALSGDITTSEGTSVTSLGNGVVTDSKVSATAAIAWTKISKSGAVAADVNALSNGNGVVSLQSGNDTSKPAAGTGGRVYVAQDTHKIYYDNGSAWVHLGVSALSELSGSISASALGTGTANNTTFLRGDQTWVAAPGVVTACPSGWLMVGDPGKKATYCIDGTSRAAAGWHTAFDNCSAINDSTLGRAHLCTMVEYRMACTTHASVLAAGQHWVADLTGSGGLMLGNDSENSCDPTMGVNIYTSENYRCCIK